MLLLSQLKEQCFSHLKVIKPAIQKCRQRGRFITWSIVFIFVFVVTFFPLAYHESWFDPFTTLNVPNHLLHPHSINQVGFRDPTDPARTRVFVDVPTVQALIHELSHAKQTPLIREDMLNPGETVYLTLHCQATRFHPAQDYAIIYYPESNLILFGHQFYQINFAAIGLLNTMVQQTVPGWWNEHTQQRNGIN